MMPTLQDVANLAGVSTATVSKVLSNTPYVSAATRDKVMAAIAKLDYRPNLAARALSGGKSHIIAVVFPYVYEAIFTDPYVMTILGGVEAVLSPVGYNILLSTPQLSSAGSDESFSRLLTSGYLQGVIAIDNVPIASVAEEAERFHIPTVAIGYHQATCTIRCDDREGGRLLMRHLLALGHRKIGLISVPIAEHLGIAERMAGLREEAAASDFALDDCPLIYGDFSVKSGADAASELLSQAPDLTAIIALNDRMAMGAIQTMAQQGRRVPEDVSVVGFDNLSTAEMVNPPLTTIDQHGAEIGTQAAEILLDMLEDETQVVHRVLAPTLVERASTAPPQYHDRQA